MEEPVTAGPIHPVGTGLHLVLSATHSSLKLESVVPWTPRSRVNTAPAPAAGEKMLLAPDDNEYKYKYEPLADLEFLLHSTRSAVLLSQS